MIVAGDVVHATARGRDPRSERHHRRERGHRGDGAEYGSDPIDPRHRRVRRGRSRLGVHEHFLDRGRRDDPPSRRLAGSGRRRFQQFAQRPRGRHLGDVRREVRHHPEAHRHELARDAEPGRPHEVRPAQRAVHEAADHLVARAVDLSEYRIDETADLLKPGLLFLQIDALLSGLLFGAGAGDLRGQRRALDRILCQRELCAQRLDDDGVPVAVVLPEVQPRLLLRDEVAGRDGLRRVPR